MSSIQARLVAVFIFLAFVGVSGALFGSGRVGLFAALGSLLVVGAWMLDRLASTLRRAARIRGARPTPDPHPGAAHPPAWLPTR